MSSTVRLRDDVLSPLFSGAFCCALVPFDLATYSPATVGLRRISSTSSLIRAKQLARTSCCSRYGKRDRPVGVVPKVSQETLAEMVGTARSRVNFFLNKFKRLASSSTSANALSR